MEPIRGRRPTEAPRGTPPRSPSWQPPAADRDPEADRDWAQRTAASTGRVDPRQVDATMPGGAAATVRELEHPTTVSAPRPTNRLIFTGVALWAVVLAFLFVW